MDKLEYKNNEDLNYDLIMLSINNCNIYYEFGVNIHKNPEYQINKFSLMSKTVEEYLKDFPTSNKKVLQKMSKDLYYIDLLHKEYVDHHDGIIIEKKKEVKKKMVKADKSIKKLNSLKNKLDDFNSGIKTAETNTPRKLRFLRNKVDKATAIENQIKEIIEENKIEFEYESVPFVDFEVEELKQNKIPGFFPTPFEALDFIVDEFDLEIEKNSKVLEPSAGVGNIAKYLKDKFNADVECVEYNYTLRNYLERNGFNVVGDDINNLSGDKKYDYIFMNPPFEKKQDILHTTKCFNEHLNSGGILISIMSGSTMQNSHKINQQFKDMVYENGRYCQLPDKSFKESGTLVSTIAVILYK